jgi:hypothetical protein
MEKHSKTWAITEIRKEAFEKGFEINPDHMAEFLKRNPKVLSEFMTCGNDTASREALGDALGVTFIGMEWPRILLGGSSYAHRWNTFCKAVMRAAMAGKCDIRTAMFRKI